MSDIISCRKRSSIVFIIFFLILNFPIYTTKVLTSIALPPDQFIGEIFVNHTLPLQLSHTNTIITFNTTDFYHKIGIQFDANYTIYNPENTTVIPVILPYSLAVNITESTIEVRVNGTQTPYDLISISPWNENVSKIDIWYLPLWTDINPIIFIRSNVTLFNNSISVINYRLSRIIGNPLASMDFFFFAYYFGTSMEWIDNTTGKVELRVYGKQPVFSGGLGSTQLIDIEGGKSFICQWNNIKMEGALVGIRYQIISTPRNIFVEIFGYSLFICIPTIVIIIIIAFRREKRKRSQGVAF